VWGCYGVPAATSLWATGACSGCPAIDGISTEVNFLGNLVGNYGDLVELMAVTAQGKVRLHTQT
jgi:hypothetical protein